MKKTAKKQIVTISFDILLISLVLIGQKFYEKLMALLPECIILTLTGRQCGSCGGTRCVYNFFTGNFPAAFQFNSFFFFVIIYVILLITLANLAFVFKVKSAEKPLKVIADYRIFIIFATGYFIFTLIRLFM